MQETVNPPHDAPDVAAQPTRRLHRQVRLAWRVMLGAVLALAVAGEVAWWGLNATVTNFPGAHFNQGHNATWLAHAWVGESHTASDYDALAALLQREQIGYVFAHVGPLAEDGTIPTARFPNAATFASEMHAHLPNLRILAWIGQVYAPGAQPGDAAIDIAQSQTRDNIAATAAIFTSRLDFDGVHFDIEPIPNNDPRFLDLLDDTRTQIGPAKLMSLSTPNWIPVARVTDALQALRAQPNVWWTTYYYQVVSQHVDQIVAMMYNTGMPTAPLYETIVQQETAHILHAVAQASPHTRVIIGIPTYTDASSRAFHASAENMRTGLRGVINGLNENDGLSAFDGLAIYPEWLTTSADWSLYEQQWLGH